MLIVSLWLLLHLISPRFFATSPLTCRWATQAPAFLFGMLPPPRPRAQGRPGSRPRKTLAGLGLN